MGEVLTREVMGAFALGVLWLNTLLVAAAALGRARELARRRRALRKLDLDAPGSYGVARVTGEEGLALLAIEQVGRWAAGRKRAILWHDRKQSSAVRGGQVALGGRSIRVEAATAGAETWLPPARVTAAAACADGNAFDAAWPEARKARGSARELKVETRAGELWVAGTLRREGDELVLFSDGEDRPLVVAEIDPRAWLGQRITMLFVFAPATVVGAALCTAVALWPPVFEGVVSRVGGLLCFVYFLLVLPAGTRARDAALEPPRRLLRGRWDDPQTRDVAPAPATTA